MSCCSIISNTISRTNYGHQVDHRDFSRYAHCNCQFATNYQNTKNQESGSCFAVDVFNINDRQWALGMVWHIIIRLANYYHQYFFLFLRCGDDYLKAGLRQATNFIRLIRFYLYPFSSPSPL